MIGEGARTVAASDTAVVDATPEIAERSVAAAPVTTDLVTPDLVPNVPPSVAVQEAAVVTAMSNESEPDVPVRTADIDRGATAEDAEGLAAHRDADPETPSEDVRAIEDERAEAPRAVTHEPESVIDIDEDPGHLFEPMPISGTLYSLPVQTTVIMVTPIAPDPKCAAAFALNRPTIVPNNNPVGARAAAEQQVPATAAATATEAGVRQASEPPAAAPAEAANDVSARPLADTLPHANGGAAPIALEISQQEPSDPLAPIRALREEELIALFS